MVERSSGPTPSATGFAQLPSYTARPAAIGHTQRIPTTPATALRRAPAPTAPGATHTPVQPARPRTPALSIPLPVQRAQATPPTPPTSTPTPASAPPTPVRVQRRVSEAPPAHAPPVPPPGSRGAPAASRSGTADFRPRELDDRQIDELADRMAEPIGQRMDVTAKFDPRKLTSHQLDELTHRLIGRVTRLVRTELRMDRERIGKLRDPRR
ncbi:extensin [Streptomyces sp. NPDC005808]|uniref:extensin n=1 Tax=Streptomyces sp. NPDC005808 TaxID=3364734 RepID=UPI0036895BDB